MRHAVYGRTLMTPCAVLDALLDSPELVLLADCYMQLIPHQTLDLQCCGCNRCKLALASAANSAAAATPARPWQFQTVATLCTHCSTSISSANVALWLLRGGVKQYVWQLIACTCQSENGMCALYATVLGLGISRRCLSP